MALNRRLATTYTPAGSKPLMFPGSGGVQNSDIKKVEVFARFDTNGAGAPLNVQGDYVTVTRVSTGLYQVQLGGPTIALGKYTPLKQVINVQPFLNTAAASVLRAQGGTIDQVNGTFQVRIIDATATLTDLAAATGNTVFMQIVFSNGAL